MELEKIQDFRGDFALFIEAGFVAVKQLDEMSAKRLFEAAQLLNPQSTAPQIGLGYIALNKLQLKEASQIFENVMEKDPENYLAQTFLGICYLLSKQKRKKGERLINEAMEKTTDQTVRNLGLISLEWGERDLKQTNKAPFFADAKEE